MKKKSRETAYDKIQELIYSMQIKPGQSVTENALSEQLGIGRTPVREALARLESEGLIYSNNGRKSVYSVTIDEIEEIFDIKSVLEGAIASWAAERGTKGEKNELERIIKDMKSLAEVRPENEKDRKKYLDSWLTLDKKLHKQIFKMARCKKAEQIVEKLNIQWHRTRVSLYALEGRIARSAKEHEEFVNHIIKGESQKAELAMKKHLSTLTIEIENIMRLFNYPVH